LIRPSEDREIASKRAAANPSRRPSPIHSSSSEAQGARRPTLRRQTIAARSSQKGLGTLSMSSSLVHRPVIDHARVPQGGRECARSLLLNDGAGRLDFGAATRRLGFRGSTEAAIGVAVRRLRVKPRLLRCNKDGRRATFVIAMRFRTSNPMGSFSQNRISPVPIAAARSSWGARR